MEKNFDKWGREKQQILQFTEGFFTACQQFIGNVLVQTA